MQNATAATPVDTQVKVLSATGYRFAEFVRVNADGTTTVRKDGKNRKVRSANVYIP